jgi:hypothetical protein
MDLPATPTDQGKMWAAVSYAGFLFGLPLGIIPMIQRDDAFALFHAKQATAVWLVTFVSAVVLSIVVTVVSIVTCGFGAILYPLVFLPGLWLFAVGIHGLILSINGEAREPIATFGLGEKIFGSIKTKDVLPGP